MTPNPAPVTTSDAERAATFFEPVAYLHYAGKKPSLRCLSFSAQPSAEQKANGWKTIALTERRPLPVAPTKLRIDFKQATELLAMFGGEPGEVTLLTGEGHSGRGLYAHAAGHGEDGAQFLGTADDEAVISKKASPAAYEYQDRVQGRHSFLDPEHWSEWKPLVSQYHRSVHDMAKDMSASPDKYRVRALYLAPQSEEGSLFLGVADGDAVGGEGEQVAQAFLRQMASLPGTIIRSSRDLSPQAITEARASSGWLALRDGLGFAIMAESERQIAEDEPASPSVGRDQ